MRASSFRSPPPWRERSVRALREHLDIGRVFSAIADLYKGNAGLLLGAALVIFLALALVTGLLISISPLLIIITAVVAFVAQYWYQGMVIELVNRVHGGSGVPGLGELFGAVGPRLGRLIAAGLLAGIAIAIGLILLIVPGLYLLTIWAVIAPVIVIEGAAVGASFRRSQQLVKGDGWQVCGVLVVLFLIAAVIGFVVRGVFGGDDFLGAFLGSLIPNLLLAPVSALAAAVIYFELRRLKEGAAVAGGPGAPGVPAGQAPYPGGGRPGYGQPQPGYAPQPEYGQQPGYPQQGAPQEPYRQPPPGGGPPPSAPAPGA